MNFARWGRYRIKNRLVREGLAEFLGTCILVLFGIGAGAQLTLSRGDKGSIDGAHWGIGIGVALGIYVAGGVSGGHINPCLSLALACVGKLEWRKLPVYMISQYLGSFTASCLMYLLYQDALNHFDGGTRQFDGENGTAGIWATYPQSFTSLPTVLGDEVLTTAVFLILTMAIIDNRNLQTPKALVPLAVGLVVVGLGMSFHLNCGYMVNPARDLAPRIFTAIAGWGTRPFSFRDYQWFWVPVIAPYVGAVLGAFIYQILVGYHWPSEDSDILERDTALQSYGNMAYKVTDGKLDTGQDNIAFEKKEFTQF